MHEMDAIRCKEWRIFPVLSMIKDDKLGFNIFILAHIPLFYFLFKYLSVNNNAAFRLGLDYFLIIHLGLHLFFLLHKKNEFKDWVSWSIIGGAAFCGLLDMVMA
jgi:L-cystine uptake protein TcyP (sodium:dicarboxylate symporter family)